MSIFRMILSLLNEKKTPAFKIESTLEDPTTGLIYFLIKIQNKCVHPVKKDPIELIKKARSKNYFSEKDYDWIIDIMLENQKRLIENKFKKPFLFIKHQFSEQLMEPLVVYKDRNSKIFIKPAAEIYSSVESLNKFSSEDSACIGNIVGSHAAEKEYKLYMESKTPNLIKHDTAPLFD